MRHCVGSLPGVSATVHHAPPCQLDDDGNTPQREKVEEEPVFNKNDFSARLFLLSVSNNLPVLQDNPSAVQVALWLDCTVYKFQFTLPEGRSYHLASMLLSRIPLIKWRCLEKQGLTRPESDCSFETFKKHVFKCVSGPSYVKQLQKAYAELKQQPKENPSGFLQRLSEVHRYLYQYGNGLVNDEEVGVISLREKCNMVTGKFLDKHIYGQGSVSFKSCSEYLFEQEWNIIEAYAKELSLQDRRSTTYRGGNTKRAHDNTHSWVERSSGGCGFAFKNNKMPRYQTQS